MVLDPLKRRDDEPMFDEPWQAQVLGMADMLMTAGVVSADAWARTLGAELGKSSASGPEDNVEAYYRPVLAALQILLGLGFYRFWSRWADGCHRCFLPHSKDEPEYSTRFNARGTRQ